MHAYLIVGQNLKEINLEVEKISKKKLAKKMYFEISKIDDVRNLTKLTKFTFSENTVIILKNFDNASEEAQNAFLKNLEEPVKNLLFILTAKNEDLVLPTISSRCELIRIKERGETSDKLKKAAKEFFELSEEKKILTISEIKGRVEAKEFLLNLIKGWEALLKKDFRYARPLENAEKALQAIESNANVQLQLTNFILSSPIEK